jgi:hypothetical protein
MSIQCQLEALHEAYLADEWKGGKTNRFSTS